MLEWRSDSGAMDARRVRNRADDFAAVGIQNFDLGSVRDIEPARRTIYRDVIKAAGAAYRIATDDLIASCALKQQRAEEKSS